MSVTGPEKTKHLKLFDWAKHPSGIPWMRCAECSGRINHQGKIAELAKPHTYGLGADATIITHEAEYRCKCGATRIIVEGTVETYDVHGCLLEKTGK